MSETWFKYDRAMKRLSVRMREADQLINPIALLTAERDEARALAQEIHGHTKCECFHRNLPADHWLWEDTREGVEG